MAKPTETPVRERREISVRGIVQGVGFRPFVYSLARKYSLAGTVRNDAEGVRIEAEGEPGNLDQFLRALETDAPPLAVVEAVVWRSLDISDESGFRIEESAAGVHRHALVSPDVATCDECLAEILDPDDRRFRYPFTNCTNCGPRFTISRSVPYDRATTTMSRFTMCRDCQSEYDDPTDRRFHAQPNACPECGPRVRLLDKFGHEMRGKPEAPITRAANMLRGRAVVAIKGLGGYHLACDPFDEKAVASLRSRKFRQDKPFALMARDVEQARELCHVSPEEEKLLASPARPIVLLERRRNSGIAEDVAPRQNTLGVMLAYTPLHHLLLRDAGIPLVMTSGNNADEPISYRDEESFDHLGGIADYFLLHDRDVHMRCDDSVVRIVRGETYPLRRSRGYSPAPLVAPEGFGRHILACGGELKNTFCVAKDTHVFMSHHIGDLENYETFRSFREGVEHFSRLFDVEPEVVAYDLHPEYLSTKYARDLEEAGMADVVGIQHHHAHIASCLADNERPSDERVIGVAFDGTGYGTDGAIWGGEFFEGSVSDGFERRGHIRYAPLPGGSAAIREPWRMAVAHLVGIYGEDEVVRMPLAAVRNAGERNVRLISRLVERNINTPPTSSAGRLFDAVAALAGVPGSFRTTYEGQAAIELELAAKGEVDTGYPFRLAVDCGSVESSGSGFQEILSPTTPRGRGGATFMDSDARGEEWTVETDEVIAGVVGELLSGSGADEVSAKFHRTMAEVILAGCERVQEKDGTSIVALSGGTFQNMRLLEGATGMLEEKGFTVYRHRRVPTGDGGISLGQAVLANAAIEKS